MSTSDDYEDSDVRAERLAAAIHLMVDSWEDYYRLRDLQRQQHTRLYQLGKPVLEDCDDPIYR